MKHAVLAILASSSVAFTAASAAADKLTYPQKRGATDDEVRAHQSLGRFVIAPDGSYFLYEWSRPYGWSPSTKGVSAAAAARKMTYIYKVDATADKAATELLFQPAPGATYYLGDLSPDGKSVSFYEIDRDDNTIRAASVLTNDGISPRIVWFDAKPDVAQLNKPAVWRASDTLAYPTNKGWVQGAISEKMPEVPLGGALPDNTVKTQSCGDCGAAMFGKAEGTATPAGAGDKQGLPDGAKLLAQSGDLAVYCIDKPDSLSLLFSKGDSVQTVFENDRRPQAVVLAERKKEPFSPMN